VSSFSTGTQPGGGTTAVVRPTFVGTPSATTAFWTPTGGLQPKDTGSTDPVFADGDLVIRGGQIGINFTVVDAMTTEVTIRVWTVWLHSEPNDAAVPPVVSYGAQLTSAPDFEAKFGKVIDYKEATVNNSYPSFSYVRRMKVQKIDMETHATQGGRQIAFVVACTNMQGADDETIQSVIWHDLSFTGDVVDFVA